MKAPSRQLVTIYSDPALSPWGHWKSATVEIERRSQSQASKRPSSTVKKSSGPLALHSSPKVSEDLHVTGTSILGSPGRLKVSASPSVFVPPRSRTGLGSPLMAVHPSDPRADISLSLSVRSMSRLRLGDL